MRIMFEQLPDVDKILRLCRSVYMVRENKQYLLEEELYSKIIFLYRSPETMIKYTKKEKDKETIAIEAPGQEGLRQRRRKTHSRNASASQGAARSNDDESLQNKRSASLISLSSYKKDEWTSKSNFNWNTLLRQSILSKIWKCNSFSFMQSFPFKLALF